MRDALKHGWVVVGGLTATVAVPMIVALVALASPRWLAMTDVALVEMRVRDVGLSNPPFVGLNGRFKGYGEAGSHPGPLSFYGLAPLYRLFGSTGWALLVSTSALSLAAAATAIWIGFRRGGWRFALAVAAVVVLLARAYGIERLANAWNPDLPLLWWFVFLLAVWSVLCDDLAMFPVAIFAGSYAVQTHFPYGGPVVAAGALAAAYLGYRLYRTWGEPDERRTVARWLGLGGGLLAVLWLLPLAYEVKKNPGNLAIIVENFRNPEEDRVRVPFGDAWNAWLGHLNIDQMLRGQVDRGLLRKAGPSQAGLALLVAWVGAAVLAWRRRDPAMIRLHLVVAVAFVAGLLSISRILGILYPYLMQWAWGTTALMFLATVWTVLATAPASVGTPEEARSATRVAEPRLAQASVAGLAAVALLVSALFTFDAASAEPGDPKLRRSLDNLAAATVDHLGEDPVGCGDECRYVVTVVDPINMSSQALGLIVELERQGIAARAEPHQEVAVRAHRVLERADADAIIHVATAEPAISEARDRSGAVEVGYYDPYTSAERAEQEPRVEELVSALDGAGHVDMAGQVRQHGALGNTLSVVADLPDDLLEEIVWFSSLSRPSAVFLIPPDS